MPKPYSILAAALAASGRSLSTVTLAAPVEFHPVWAGRQTEDWLLDSNREGSLELESPFTMDPFVRRAPADVATLSRIAPGYELGSKRIFPQTPISSDARFRRNPAPRHALKTMERLKCETL